MDDLEGLLIYVAGFIDLAHIRLQTLFWQEDSTLADLAADGIVRSTKLHLDSIEGVVSQIHQVQAIHPTSAQAKDIWSPSLDSVCDECDALLPTLAGFVDLLKARLHSLLQQENSGRSTIVAEGVAAVADLVLTDIALTVDRLRRDFGTQPALGIEQSGETASQERRVAA